MPRQQRPSIDRDTFKLIRVDGAETIHAALVGYERGANPLAFPASQTALVTILAMSQTEHFPGSLLSPESAARLVIWRSVI